MKLPIGISDFKEIIEDNYYYVDKTLLIKELKHTNGKVLLIPRPRRFGKTLNLSMLRYFYEKSEENNSHLFKNTAIWQDPKFHKYQGAYPVIFITFKSCKDERWEKNYGDMINVIGREFERHLDDIAPTLKQHELNDYMAIINKTATPSLYTNSLFFLSILLKRHYKKKVIVLIDEYDAPIHAAHMHGYYKEMISFIRALLTDALKDNSYLERGILTGILRTAKEGVFSGLNNLSVKTVLDDKFSDKFGFTQPEVDQLLIDAKLTKKSDIVKEWYNGYRSGKTTMYNPWSLLECINQKGATDTYWANTSDNELIKKIIAQADETVKTELESLLKNIPIIKEIDNGLIFPGIENNENAIWSLLLFAGYLTFMSVKRSDNKTICKLILPNKEIKLLYRALITSILEQSLSGSRMRYLKESLIKADGVLFGQMLQDFTLKSTSMFDLPESEPERSYHLFVLGLMVSMSDIFEVKSNRESGYGRYDILLIPHDKKGWGIIMEFKKALHASDEPMEEIAQAALDQIKDREYVHELQERGIKKIAAFGVACMKKKILVKSQILAT